jgi:hypothetical protein
MKYLSLLLLLGLMVWSWSMATAKPSFTLEQHKRVEAGVEEDVRGFILRKYPNTSDIYCQQLYTEVMKPNEEMIAHFRCRTEGETTTAQKVQQTFQGFIYLKSQNNFQTWEEVGGEITSPGIQFATEMRINAKDPMPPASAEEQTEEAASPAPAEHETH